MFKMTVGSQVKTCFSSIKSAEAMLHILAQQTNHQEAIEAFNKAELILSEVKTDLQKQILYLHREEPQY